MSTRPGRKMEKRVSARGQSNSRVILYRVELEVKGVDTVFLLDYSDS